MPSAIECRGLVKRYPDVVAVGGVDLDVHTGECFGLLGPNGAGKTTTVEICEGLTTPDAGDVVVLGKRWSDRRGADDLRQSIGIQLQETQLADKLQVDELVYLFRSFYHRGKDVEALLERLELSGKRTSRYHKLSGGQRQRVALATALVGDPELLFLDEPTTGLDPAARFALWDIVNDYKASGGTVVLTTHYMEEAAQLCDRIAVMDGGKVIALGSPQSLVAALGGKQVVEVEVDGELDLGAMDGHDAVVSITKRGSMFVVEVKDPIVVVPKICEIAAAQSANIVHLVTRQPTLDDVFVSLTGRSLRDG